MPPKFPAYIVSHMKLHLHQSNADRINCSSPVAEANVWQPAIRATIAKLEFRLLWRQLSKEGARKTRCISIMIRCIRCLSWIRCRKVGCTVVFELCRGSQDSGLKIGRVVEAFWKGDCIEYTGILHFTWPQVK